MTKKFTIRKERKKNRIENNVAWTQEIYRETERECRENKKLHVESWCENDRHRWKAIALKSTRWIRIWIVFWCFVTHCECQSVLIEGLNPHGFASIDIESQSLQVLVLFSFLFHFFFCLRRKCYSKTICTYVLLSLLNPKSIFNFLVFGFYFRQIVPDSILIFYF